MILAHFKELTKLISITIIIVIYKAIFIVIYLIYYIKIMYREVVL